MTLDTLVTDARARLLARAKREGLADVGYTVVDSPLGPLWIAVGPRGVAVINYGAEPNAADLGRLLRTYGPGIVPDPRRTSAVARELDQYFAGRRRDFDLTLDIEWLPDFQRSVLEELARVPYGRTETYGSLAARIGRPRAARAVGGALNRNPLPIVLPCHRVVGASGSLVGYAGGLERKRALLELEGVPG